MASPARGNKTMFFLTLWFFFSSLVLGIVLAAMGLEGNIMLAIALSQIVGLFLPFLLYLLLTKQRPAMVLKFKRLGVKNTALIVILTIAFLPVVNLISFLSSFLFFPVIGEITMDIAVYPMWISFLMIAVLPSLFEEFIFRGAIYREYEGVPIKKKVLITALFFGIIHLNFHQAIYAAALGIVLAYVLYRTESIWAPILMHLVNNGVAVLLSYVAIPEVEGYYDAVPGALSILLVLGIGSAIMAPIAYLCLKHLRPLAPGPEDLPASPVEPQIDQRPEQAYQQQPYYDPQAYYEQHAYQRAQYAPQMQPQAYPAPPPSPAPPAQKIFDWAFWATVGVFILFGALMEIGSRLMALGLY